MLHNVRMIQRHFPRQAHRVAAVAAALSLGGIALGLGALLLG